MLARETMTGEALKVRSDKKKPREERAEREVIRVNHHQITIKAPVAANNKRKTSIRNES